MERWYRVMWKKVFNTSNPPFYNLQINDTEREDDCVSLNVPHFLLKIMPTSAAHFV
jgi:hypothetical protein